VIKEVSSVKKVSPTPTPGPSDSQQLTEDEQKQLNEELSTREGSKLFRCDTHNEAKVRRKTVKWPWKITCGICSRNVQLRYDADFKGRISSFERRKYFIILTLSRQD